VGGCNSKILGAQRMKELQAIIFDFDGVLVESVDVKGDAFVALYKYETPEIREKVKRYHSEHGGISRFEKIRYYDGGAFW
jgi:beta-phosphoglucomutase-like phosphatase (HAD superfamily)